MVSTDAAAVEKLACKRKRPSVEGVIKVGKPAPVLVFSNKRSVPVAPLIEYAAMQPAPSCDSPSIPTTYRTMFSGCSTINAALSKSATFKNDPTSPFKRSNAVQYIPLPSDPSYVLTYIKECPFIRSTFLSLENSITLYRKMIRYNSHYLTTGINA